MEKPIYFEIRTWHDTRQVLARLLMCHWRSYDKIMGMHSGEFVKLNAFIILGPLLLTRINFKPSMDKWSHAQ